MLANNHTLNHVTKKRTFTNYNLSTGFQTNLISSPKDARSGIHPKNAPGLPPWSSRPESLGIGKYAHFQALSLQPYFVFNCQSFCSVLSQDEPSDIYELARHPLHWPHSVVLFHFTPSFPHDHLRRKATNCGQLADEFTLQNLVDTAMNTLKGTSVPSRFSELSTLISNIPRCFSKRSKWLLPAQRTSGYQVARGYLAASCAMDNRLFRASGAPPQFWRLPAKQAAKRWDGTPKRVRSYRTASKKLQGAAKTAHDDA